MKLKLHKIKHKFKTSHLEDIPKKLIVELEAINHIFKGKTHIAVGVGSRGIANIDLIVKTVIDYLKELGSSPFIIPAMGSHGGATPEGQLAILDSYGINETTMGVPFKSSMEVVELPSEGLRNKLFIDQNAYNSDGVILINRIKPHTDFHGTYESGLAKMAVIGLGKQKQAIEIHNHGAKGLRDLIPPSAEQILGSGKILAGIGIVENAYDQTLMIKAIPAKDIMEEELDLIRIARENMPYLPVSNAHILIVDQMGKDISGVGMDSNIIGRLMVERFPEPDKPKIDRIMVTDLTEATHGNAAGIGLADVTTKRLFDKIDHKVTLQNVATSTFLERGKIPLIADTDEQAFEICKRSLGPLPEEDLRIIRIKDTLHLGELYVSQAIWWEIKDNIVIDMITEDQNAFDENGFLIPF